MYSIGNREFVVALDRATGATLWEKENLAPADGLLLQVESLNVRGPHSTPLVSGELLITVGVRGLMQAFDKATGRLVWSHDLWREYGGTRAERGYVCSPLAFQNLVIVTIGGAGQALAAFDTKTGALVWKKLTFRHSPSSPVLITVDGQDQVVMAFADQFVGVDPNNGAMLWQHAHPCGGFNIAPAVWGADNLLFISSAYECGARALRLSQSAGRTTVTELWANARLRVHHGTIVRVGDMAIGSSGSGPAPLTAVDVRTGALLWQDRRFPKATFVLAAGRLILLDEDGQLALVGVSRQGATILARAPQLESLAWTPPTLAGTTLYIRDQKRIMALDLK
jgi:outer membrane protein assembly factor BamB